MSVHQSQAMGFLDQIPWVLSSPVVVGSHRDDLFTRKLPGQVLDFLLLRRKFYKQNVSLAKSILGLG